MDKRLTEAEARSLIVGRGATPPGDWYCVGDLGLGEFAWAHNTRPEAIVHRVTLLGYEPADRRDLLCGLLEGLDPYRALEREAQREIRLLGTVLHQTLTHHVLGDVPTLTTLWAEVWPSHNLAADESEDDTHEPVEVEDWHYAYLDRNLTPTGTLPTVARVIWRRALRTIFHAHPETALQGVDAD